MNRLDELTAQLSSDPSAAALFQDPAQAAPGAAPASPAAPAPRAPTPGAQPGMLSRIASDIGTGITEAPAQVTRGVAEAVDASAGWLYDGSLAAYLPESRSVTGGIINDVSQFLTGFVAAGRALRVVGLARGAVAGASVGARLGTAMAQGAIADAAFFDGQEERLSNLIEQHPSLSNPITQYLAARPDDSELEGRFKNAVEGIVSGAAVDGLLAALRGIRRLRGGDVAGAADEAHAAGPGPSDPFTPEAAAARQAEGEMPGVQSAAPDDTIDVTVTANAPAGGAGVASRVGRQRELYARAEDRAIGNIIEERVPGAELIDTPRPVQARHAAALIEMTPEQHRAATRAVIEEGANPEVRNLSGIRTDLIEGDDDLARVFNAHETVVREQLADLKGPDYVSLADTRRLADELASELGGKPQLILQRMVAEAGDVQHAHARLLTYRDLLATTAERHWAIAKALADPNGVDLRGYATREELADAFDRTRTLMVNMQGLYKGIQSSYARGLNAMRVAARSSDDLGRRLEDIRIDALRASMTEGNLKGALDAARGSVSRRITGSINEYWINSVLSGPKTHAVNALSNMAAAIFQPTERLIAGALTLNRREFIEGGLQYAGLISSVKEAVQLAGRAFRQGDGIIDPGRSPVERRAYITADRFNVDSQLGASVVNGLGNFVRLPSRLLTTSDELFKQLTYRSRIRAEAWAEGLTSGHPVGSKGFGETVQTRLDEAFGPNGEALNPDHLAAARNATFSDDLQASTWGGQRTMGETLMNVTGNHPFLQVVMPFVRTPTNIARWVWDRTPGINLLRRQYVEDLFGSSVEARGRALAKFATGGAMWATATSMALDGGLTGGGPSDPAAKRELEASGWRAYSVAHRQPDGSVRYMAYDRLDPFGTVLGLAADVAEVAGFMRERDHEQLATDMVVALARQLQNKTYMSGLTRALGALAEPDRKGERFVNGLAGSFMPSAVNQLLRDDPYMREVRGVVDALRARAPGSEGMDPVRNILGEAVQVPPGWGPDTISPIATTTWAGNAAPPNTPEWRQTVQRDVHGEIARQLVVHGSAIRPPAPKMGDVDLRQFRVGETDHTAYDRYQALVGEVKVGGLTIHQRLDALIQSPSYLRASDGTFDHDGSRVDLIRRVIGAYRSVAERELRREMPEVGDALRADERIRAITRRPTAQVQ